MSHLRSDAYRLDRRILISFFKKTITFDLLTPLPPLPGLEYSAGEGTNYPPKFDSAPGKPALTLLSLCIRHSV